MIFEKLYDGNSATKTKAVIYEDKAERKKTKLNVRRQSRNV